MYEEYMHQGELGVPIRYAQCPFCKERVSSKGFIVTRTPRGYKMWCHLCHTGKFIRSKTPGAELCMASARKFVQPTEQVVRETLVVRLPLDYTTEIPAEARLWLESYGVSEQEMSMICGWSSRYQRLILSVRDTKGRLIYWTGRYFGTDSKQPKYINVKSKKTTVVFDTNSLGIFKEATEQVVVVVEDIISALAVGRSGFQAIALLGSYLDDKLSSTVLSQYRQVVLWLDSDKRCESAKSVKRLRVIGTDAYAILNKDGDPKDYSSEEIREVLHEKTKHLSTSG